MFLTLFFSDQGYGKNTPAGKSKFRRRINRRRKCPLGQYCMIPNRCLSTNIICCRYCYVLVLLFLLFSISERRLSMSLHQDNIIYIKHADIRAWELRRYVFIRIFNHIPILDKCCLPIRHES